MTARRGLRIDRFGAVVIALLALVTTALVTIAVVGFDTVSAARAYVAGEGRWSKAQQEAVYYLARYATTREQQYYRAYERAIAVPLGDRVAREELERPDPDPAVVSRGFIQGANHPDDVARMARFYRRFRRVSYVDSAIGIWANGDRLIALLRREAEALDAAIQRGDTSAATLAPIVQRIERIDQTLRPLETAFSDVLGEGARWAAGLLTVVALVSGALLLLGGVSATVVLTRRLRATEAAVQASEARYRTLVEDANYGIGRTTPDGRIAAANPALVRILGYESEAEIRALDIARDVYERPEDRALVLQHFQATGRAATPIEVRWRRCDEQRIIVRLSGRTRYDSAGMVAGYDVIVEDVTEQKALEDQLRQSQKMEAVGQLTGGIAHDLNNLLTAILANADLVAAAVSDQPEVRGDIAELQQAARRGAQMIRKLMAFSRQERLVRAPHYLGTLVGDMVSVLRRVLPEHITIRVESDEALPAALVDPGAVEQMLVNLATNARDAMPHGGVLTVHTGRDGIADDAVRRGEAERAGQFVTIAVQDTGTGMDEATRRRVFEPFFTTKPVGAGSGLGLSMVYGLMRQHEGFVRIESEPGHGSTVVLFFPASADAAPAPPRPAAEPVLARRTGRGETILLVEDEDVVRRSAARVLTQLGYEVIEAENGAVALHVIAQHDAGIDLVITDVVMPVMGGRRLYEEARRVGYRIPFLFTSGYTDRETGEGVGLEPGLPYLEKPWTPAALAARVEELLRRGRGRHTAPIASA